MSRLLVGISSCARCMRGVGRVLSEESREQRVDWHVVTEDACNVLAISEAQRLSVTGRPNTWPAWAFVQMMMYHDFSGCTQYSSRFRVHSALIHASFRPFLLDSWNDSAAELSCIGRAAHRAQAARHILTPAIRVGWLVVFNARQRGGPLRTSRRA